MNTWGRQRDLLTSVRDYDRVAVKAGRKVSKSYSIAIIALWWVLANDGRVLMTSSSFEQLKGIVWPELSALTSRLSIETPLDPKTGIRINDAPVIVGRSTNKRENMQGYGGAKGMYIVDEASGVQTEIFEAIDGNTAGGGKVIMLGNPTITAGYYYDAFHSNRDSWRTLTISSRESPNVTGEASIPGLATEKWIEKTEIDYGAESPYVEIHIDGQFPTQGTSSVISLSLIEQSQSRQALEGPLSVGVDVARYGDDETVIQGVRGNTSLKPLVVSSMDGVEVAGKVLEYISQHQIDGEEVTVKVDVIGYGSSCFDHLKHSERAERLNVQAVPVNVAETKLLGVRIEDYHNLRSMLWFALRDWLTEGKLHRDTKLETELVTPTYTFDSQGRYVVMDKKTMKQKYGRSPDRADALALAVFTPPQARRLPSGAVIT